MPIRISNRVRRFALPFLFILVLAALSGCTPHHNQSTFGAAGPIAERQKDIFVLIFWVAMAVFVVVEAAIIAITLAYRRRHVEGLPEQMHGNNRLEVAWTIAPAVVLAIIAIPTVNLIFSLDREATAAASNLEVVVTGHQWWWEVEYTGEDVVTANEVHIPVGTAVRIVLHSEDVIHSFWVPKLAGKVDLIPTRANQLVVEATEPGVYFGQCAEFCGEAHALMRFKVVAHEKDDFAVWLDGMRRPALPPAPGSPAAAGQAIFAGNCSMCHSSQTTNPELARSERDTQGVRQEQFLKDLEDSAIIAAPNLTHLATRLTLGAGVRDLNEGTLAAWIRDPNDLKPGNRMKKLANVYRTQGLNDDQINQVVAYLMTLKPGPAGQAPAGQPAGGAPAGDPVARGKQLFTSAGCSGCHATTPDNIVGPGLGGVETRAATRKPGMSSDDYIRESIVNPAAFLVEGFPPVMPANFAQTLSADDLNALIAYLKTLN
ncbi:MAG: cytochrome c oxidase subunit II [Chloroflexi bacterium]|nr:cytochrome c oxidase subunit II [Chloroflexota bacterium]